jgi:pyridoxal phosphate enzyme (YggS family)
MSLNNKLDNIRLRIDQAQKRSGFNHPVRFVAVTKTHPFSTIEKCFKAGITSIGENKIQEATQKFKALELIPGLEKRFIGNLQSNKVNKCLDLFDVIDSVDSVRLASKINKRAALLERNVPILLEVNTSGETQKHGFQPEQLEEMLSCIEKRNLIVKGLMTVGPKTKDKEKKRACFALLRDLRESMKQKRLVDLYMGMSGDFEIAVEVGSTIVRVGTALLGPREE